MSWSRGDSRVGLLISLFCETFTKIYFFSSVFIHPFLKVSGTREDAVLWIAMAGTHQVWALMLEGGKLPKGR